MSRSSSASSDDTSSSVDSPNLASGGAHVPSRYQHVAHTSAVVHPRSGAHNHAPHESETLRSTLNDPPRSSIDSQISTAKRYDEPPHRSTAPMADSIAASALHEGRPRDHHHPNSSGSRPHHRQQPMAALDHPAAHSHLPLSASADVSDGLIHHHLSSSAASTGTSAAAAALVGRLGDTRSIVMALQSLQEKIRKLEADRNFHQEECERARAAHEQYKHEVERQLEHERADFRRREAELQELISRAQHERSRLQAMLDENKTDLGTFRSELQLMLDRERRDATDREERLVAEIQSLRREVAEEKHFVAVTQQELHQAKTEKDVIESTTRRLESTVKDLLAMNSALVERAQHNNNNNIASGGSAVVGGSSQPTNPTYNAPRATSSAHRTGGATTNRSRQHHDPTSAAGGVQTIVRSQQLAGSGGSQRSASDKPSDGGPGASAVSALSLYGGPIRHPSPAKQPPMRFTSPAKAPLINSSTVPSPRQRTGAPSSSRTNNGAAPASSVTSPGLATSSPIDQVYAELEAELTSLKQQYALELQCMTGGASSAGSSGAQGLRPPAASSAVMTATLNALMSQIDRKTEQLKLLRVTRGTVLGSHHAAHVNAQQLKGVKRATDKAHLINALKGY